MSTFTTLPEKEQADMLASFSFADRSWTPRGLRGLTGWACRWLDLLIFESAFFGRQMLDSTQLRLSHSLELRVSLRSLLIAAACILLWRGVLRGMGLYDLRRIRTPDGYMVRCIGAVTGCTLVVALAELAAHRDPYVIVATYWAVCLSAMAGGRALLLYFDRSIRPHLRASRNVLIVGTGSRAVEVYNEMKASRDVNYSLVGYVDSELQAGHVSKDQILGTIDDLESILMHRVVDEVVIALPMKSQYQIIGETIATCEQLGIQSQYITDHFGTSLTKKRRATGATTGRMILETVHRDSRLHLKRLIDFSVALLGMVAISPLLIATAIAVKFSSAGPIIFRQQRFGYNKRTFPMYKFRSMVIDAEARQATLEHLNETSGPAFKIANDPRVTPIGRFLRKTSIDELPQLVNVLRGDMSLVGPRPLPTRDVSRFSEAWLMRRFSVKPGLTCLWQVTGRSNTDFDRWVELDLEYIDNWSLMLDLEILVKTIPAVLKGRGAS